MLLWIQRIMYYISIPRHSPLSFNLHRSQIKRMFNSLVFFSSGKKFPEHTLAVQSAMQIINPRSKAESAICIVVGKEENVFLL